ncbi:helicase-related protein [Methylovirgula sp. 4M-Z18]|uniref:helicase-related protein n=1 Tax=Methylovirgula sp. 4M-Z18 TaxID=2293567 RepID=UPI000E2FC14E|nr:helicase-related protein [Methylovirgula sp. 4M-Z18]RFB74976.1 helicase [Methylovirgula sp. 4M-Z18]
MNIAVPAPRSLKPADRSLTVTAILGPTNTGKTHYAIERLLAHSSGIIGLPLRLLAREVYNRVVARVGAERVALITGEEKIKPRNPSYWIATVEAMPRDLDVAFLAIDEVQLGADLDRGHVFTDRVLNRRGREETLLIGSGTMERVLRELIPGVNIISRPRLSTLSFAGDRKLSRLPSRSGIVAFSAEDVYAIAEFIRRQRGGAAVVLGALSPRTRNAQVDMFQNGDVDYIVATDAIGMGLNLDVDHIAFASDRKFDGWQFRRLNPAEFGQIAGRAGRHLRDGTFGTTGRCPPFDEELIERLENHEFDPVSLLQWRNADLDFSTLEGLQASLDRLPSELGLTRAPLGTDVLILDIAARDEQIKRIAATRADVQRLWEACQIPDYRKVSPSAHAELTMAIFHYIVRAGRIPDDWFARNLDLNDRVDGDIDSLSNRIAQVRTFTYIANRPDWLRDPEHWQGVARQVEDRLSDALHERLTQRFVDRRLSVLRRRLRENAMLEAEITSTGDVLVEGQHVGGLQGFRFTPDPQAAGEAAKTLNAAALKALASEIEARANRLHEAVDDAFALAMDGTIRWLGEPVAKISASDKILAPQVRVLADEHLSGALLEQVQKRLDLWLAQHVKKLLGPLFDLETGEGLEGMARGIAFLTAESLGVLDRARIADEVKGLSQDARAALRKLGLRFGAYHIYLPQLLKPAPRSLAAQLWTLKHGGLEEAKGFDEVPHMASTGRTSFPANKEVPATLYRVAGFRLCGERAVRVDILERLADLIRPAINYRPGVTPGEPPAGTADGDGFVVTVGMTSLAGCSGEDFASILRSLGYAPDKRPGPAITVPLVPAAPMEPVKVAPAEAESKPEEQLAETEAAAVVEAAPETGELATAESTEAAAEPLEMAAPVESTPETAPEPVAHVDAAPAEEAAVAPASEPKTEADAVAEPVSEQPAEAVAEVQASEPSAAAAEPTESPSAEPVVETPAEVVLIEVWRQQRQHHHGHRKPHHGKGHQQQRRGKPAAAAPSAPEAAAAAPAEPRPEQQQQRQGQRPQGRQEGPRGPRDNAQRDQHRQRPNGQRPDRQRGDKVFASTETRERASNKAPDPNSPFAKLLALKAELEGKKST